MIRLLTIALLILSLYGCKKESESINLLPAHDLSGWDTYLAPSYDTINGIRDTIPLGLNQDTLGVFTIVHEDEDHVLRVSGERNGGISTKQEFKNYHLTLEFKWGTTKWTSPDRKRDSGVLYHAVGQHGVDYGAWMRSQEFQIQEGDCGDYWGVSGGIFDIPAKKSDSGDFIFDTSQPLVSFSEKNSNGRHCIKNPDAEKPNGEWNTVEIYCLGDTSVHVMNGKVCMVLYHSRQQSGEKEIPLVQGKIQIQSEGSEVFYRNIMLRHITSLADIIPANN